MEEEAKRELRQLMDDRLSPLIVTIQRLEEGQEKMVKILQDQKVHDERIAHLRNEFEKHVTEDDKEFNEIYKRLRDAEIAPLKAEIRERETDVKEKASMIDKLVKIMVAFAPYAILGYVVFSKM